MLNCPVCGSRKFKQKDGRGFCPKCGYRHEKGFVSVYVKEDGNC